MKDQLFQLKQYTKVVADTGEFQEFAPYHPQDATTNPSLIAKAVRDLTYRPLIEEAIRKGQRSISSNPISEVLIQLFVIFGLEILKVVPGRVSIEVDPHHAFDFEGTIRQAKRYMALFRGAGMEDQRILIKIPATWEGIKAAESLEKEGICCNMTLIFNLTQAVACAEAGVTLISPFVGRILDWHKARGWSGKEPEEDPGVLFVKEVYSYYKSYGYGTEIMGASFRHIGEVIQLAGCDLLTISPSLLRELQCHDAPISRQLDSSLISKKDDVFPIPIDENRFRWSLNEDIMATEKLAEGIRSFAKATEELTACISEYTREA